MKKFLQKLLAVVRQKPGRFLLGFVVLACLGFVFYRSNQENLLLSRVTRQNQAYLFTDFLESQDPLALTKAGKIQKYRIDRSSIKRQGKDLEVTYFVNDDPSLSVTTQLGESGGVFWDKSSQASQAFKDFMADKTYRQEVATIAQLSQTIRSRDSWDSGSEQGVYESVRDKMKRRSLSQLPQVLTEVDQEAKAVGSPTYTALFLYSDLKEKEKLALVMQHMQVSIDAYHFLQMGQDGYKFWDDLSPTSDFYAAFREAVIAAFPTKLGLNEDSLGEQVHLFRSYIDKQAIDYIRTHFEGATDYEKLLAFSKKEKLAFDYTTGAVLHNRAQSGFDFTQHMKVQLPKTNTKGGYGMNNARFIEYIVDLKTGRFISEWNVYRQLPDGTYDSNPDHYSLEEGGDVANTESANYGLPRGPNNDVPSYLARSHGYLDVRHPPDTDIRRKMTKVWRPALVLSKGGRYVDIVKKGGLNDFEKWQLVQDDQKATIYDSFLASPYSGDGFERFYDQDATNGSSGQ